MMSEEYTSAELMACILSREWKDGEYGSGPGVRSAVLHAALLLARYTHAPNIVCDQAFVVNTMAPVSKLASDFSRMTSAEALSPGRGEVFLYLPKGRLDFVTLGGLQVDKYGNLNLVCIGDWHHPTLRGPGGAGLASSVWHKRVYIWMNEHDKRTFVEKVDFVTYPGFMDGPGSREKAGLKWGEPVMVVSPLAVMDFDPVSRRMRLKSTHPGITVKQVTDNTGFDLIVPKQVQITPSPTDEELDVLRTRVDPHGVLREFMPQG